MTSVSRRGLIQNSAALGCSLAASPILTPVTFAAAPWDQRLVVVLLRGGMDGLSVVQPYGDPDWVRLRPNLQARQGAESLDLDGLFALHPAMSGLEGMWRRGDLGFAHAVSTPYRDKRSHFDGQDLLEAGTSYVGEHQREGWLNRLLQSMSNVTLQTTFALGSGDMLLTKGAAPVARWSPEADLDLSPQAERLMEQIYQEDSQMQSAFRLARTLSGEGKSGVARKRKSGSVKLAEFASERLMQETRIATFSIAGWDTHRRQDRALPSALSNLTDVLKTFETTLSQDVWAKTTIVAVTEFGRTARENGTLGTDHGTGGVLVYAGGAVQGQKVAADWPGLREEQLYDRRDVMPTRDVRAYLAWILHAITGVEKHALEVDVFPRLDMGDDPRVI